MFNFAAVTFNLNKQAKVRKPSQEFYSIDINQLKTNLESTAITKKKIAE